MSEISGEQENEGNSTEFGDILALGHPAPLISESKNGRKLKAKPKVGLRLTDRDYTLLHFLYEQKFLSLPMIYYKFFDRRESPITPMPENFWVTRQRVALLKRAGLITSERVYTEPQALYLLTDDGYKVLSSKRELTLMAKPISSVDFRYYEHDKRITLCRIALEKSGKCFHWYPDRLLRIERQIPIGDSFFRFQAGMIPDGVFISSKSERIAFELELTPKKKDRYREKRNEYISLFHPQKPSTGTATEGEAPLRRVVFVACTDRIGKDLKEIFKEPSHFTVLRYETLVGGVLGREAIQP